MLTDLIGGQIQVTFNGLPSLIGQIKGNNLTPLAVGSGIRSLILPNVPTISESGYKRLETSQGRVYWRLLEHLLQSWSNYN